LFFETGNRLNRDFKIEDVLKYKDNIDGGAVLILSFREIETDAKDHLEGTPESRRRLPEPIKIEDYTAEETSEIMRRLIKHKTEFTDDTPTDIIVKILTARVMKKRTQDEDEFTNVTCMSDELDKVCERYVKRVDSEWAEWSKKNSPAEGTDVEEQKPKKGGVTVDDVLGPQAPSVRSTSKAWKEIQELVGLHQVKKEIGYLFDLAEFNQEREREGKDATPMALNRCFFGNPGVGKTTVVGLYAKILSELGLLSKGHVITKTPDDLIGKWIGHTEARTLEALEEAKGGILIIDDAHMLYNGSGRGGCSDVFRIAAIDTLVANISGSPGEDRCVILSGYEDQMDQMFLNSNPGLQRRFPLENALRFANYTEDELCQILELKMKAEGLSASEDGLKVAREVLGRMRSRPKFGNGGDVVSFLARTKLRQIDRLKSAGLSIFDLGGNPLEPRDFDPDFDRALRADENRAAIFNGMVGFEDIVEQFKRYQKMTDGMRRHDIDPRPHIPWAFVFKGPPGTGKT
jgi:Cdc6-like AAA superfamily ATPase